MYTDEYEGFPKISCLDKKKIYICQEKEGNERFYIINNVIYFMKEDSLERLDDNRKYKNYIFHLYEFIYNDRIII